MVRWHCGYNSAKKISKTAKGLNPSSPRPSLVGTNGETAEDDDDDDDEKDWRGPTDRGVV
jgi:hypothetical protein